MSQRSLLIGICTFRRASLRDTLTSLDGLYLPEGVSVSVVVADNDSDPSARDRVAALARESRFPVSYLHAPAGNISIARNAILDHAGRSGARLLAFLDDDERVDPGWAAALLRRWDETGFSAVVGPVHARYTADAPGWMQRGEIHDTLPDLDPEGHALTGYTCNVLLNLRDPALRDLRFDLSRGRSGGEDTAYFARYHAAGGRIAYAPDAIVRETVPPDRARLDWLLRRRFRMGQTHGSLICGGAGAARRGAQAALAGLKLAYCLLGAAVPDPLRRNRSLIRGALHAGAISGCLGGRDLQLYGMPSAATDRTKENT